MAMLALVGPTASGKTEAALAIARHLEAEIVSVDSMLVYRGMDVGTAKPTPEQRAAVPHHLLDLAEPSERFTVARYQELARRTLGGVARPLLVGGSGLYFRALVDDLAFPPEDPVVRAAGRDGPRGRRAHRARQRPPDHPCPRGHGDQRRAVQLVRCGMGPIPR